MRPVIFYEDGSLSDETLRIWKRYFFLIPYAPGYSVPTLAKSR